MLEGMQPKLWLMATKEVRKQRRDICHDCPNNKYSMCTECNCFLPMKISYAGSECPLKKWAAVNFGELYDENGKIKDGSA